MWFFDSVLEDTSVKTGATGSSSSSQWKKDDQDGSFLIVDDTVKVSDIPDTAVKLFDAGEENAIVSTEEVSFFSTPETSAVTEETVAIVEENSTESTLSFFEEPTEVASVAAIEESSLSMDISEPVTKAFVMDSFVSKEETVEVSDIYAPVRRAIAEYDALIARLQKNANAKDEEISDWNARVAEAKAAAKKSLEERKAIDTEMNRINEMRTVFTAQLK